MHFWHWVAFLISWFVLGPLFVMMFSTVGLGYYAGTGTSERLADQNDPLRRTGQTRSPLPGRQRPTAPAFGGALDAPAAARPASGLEPVWWTERAAPQDRPLKRAVGGD